MIELGPNWGDEQTFQVFCDGCNEEDDGEFFSLKTFITELKAKGWKIQKLNDEWEHYCPVCAEEVDK